MQYEPMNGFLFVEEGVDTRSGEAESGFKIHGGENSVVVECSIISPGDTQFAPGEIILFRRDISMRVSFDGKTGILVHKDHILARKKVA